MPGNGLQGVLFGTIHGGFGGLHIAPGAGLGFDKAQHILVPGDEVDLASMVRRAEIARDLDFATAAQVKVGVFFTATASTLVWRSLSGGGSAPRASRELGRRHG